MKKHYILSAALIAGLLCFGCSGADDDAARKIVLNDGTVTVDGEAISTDPQSAAYIADSIETHADVPETYKDTPNSIIYITRAGDYEITGAMNNVQIRVNAPEQEVNLILNNVELSNHTAPAVYIEDAADSQTAGDAGVTITLAEGSTNIINGSHIAAYTGENGIETDNDGAISSNVSLLIDGTGTLQVTGDKEGIESKMHVTVNGGTIQIASSDDAINASRDGVSVITINNGMINCAVQNGEEGDGIDSNGYIYVNGGFVVAQAHSASPDSGLDADSGIFINGGTVCATGNMYEEISGESAQPYVQFYFAQTQKGNTPLVLTDTEGNYVLAYTPANDFRILEFSSADLVNDRTYYLYNGGTLTGSVTNGIFTEVDSYTNGIQLAHRGTMTGGGHPQIPEDFDPSQRKRPDGHTPPEKPEDAPEKLEQKQHAGQLPAPPETDPPSSDYRGFPAEKPYAIQSVEFIIRSDSRVFQDIAPYTGTEDANTIK